MVYASATMPGTMGKFSGKYAVPDQSPAPTGGELLYYFLGLQNDGQTDLTIIQPVVTYCANCGDHQVPNGWSMMATNCCPAGQTWYGPVVSITQGASIDALVTSNVSDAFISMTYNSKTSSLTVKDNNRVFNWAAVTLEEYNVEQCSEYTSSPFEVSNMVLTTAAGANVSPKWSSNNDVVCHGSAQIVSPSDVKIIGTSSS